MHDGNAIGERLRRIRRERGLTQEQLAESAQLSKDLIQKLEQGRRTSARVTSLMRLANALDVDLSALVGKRDRIGTDRDGGSVLAVRDALLSPALLPGLPGLDAADAGEPTPLAELETAVRSGWERYWRGQFGPLAAAVPGLITEARLTHRSLGTVAASALAQAYQLAACLMVHLGKDDLAAIGAERGILAAADGDDELQWATLNGTYSWVLLHQARLDVAEQHALQIAQQIEPSISKATPEHLTVWGGLVLTALAPAAAAGRASAAREHISLSRAAAARLGHDRLDYNVNFGPTQVAMQDTHAHSVLGEPGRALQAAADVQREVLRPISYGSHLLDVAQAHTDARHRRAAVVKLQEARDMSPVWFRHQNLARSLVREIREVETRPSPAIRSLVASLGIED
jgi:transcriptional regulator with XRE-family HTH domain